MVMSKNPYAPSFNDLPQTLPVFPLTGVLLMPHGQLPLNIFEPRYVAMLEDALAGGRMIGMVQPLIPGSAQSSDPIKIYQSGCAGKITEFSETTDGSYRVTLTGICRFNIAAELDTLSPYRLVKPDWKMFKDDLGAKKCLGVDREKLKTLLSQYFKDQDMSCDFEKFETIEDGKLMTCLAMICPFEPSEKQALLEEICCIERSKMFITMLEMAIHSGKPLDKSKEQCH